MYIYTYIYMFCIHMFLCIYMHTKATPPNESSTISETHPENWTKEFVEPGGRWDQP